MKTPSLLIGGGWQGKAVDTSPYCMRYFEVPNGTLQDEKLDIETSIDLGFERLNMIDYDINGNWGNGFNAPFGGPPPHPYPVELRQSLVTTGYHFFAASRAEYYINGRRQNAGFGDLTLPLDQAFYTTEIGIRNSRNGGYVRQAFYSTPLTRYHNTLSNHQIKVKQISPVVLDDDLNQYVCDLDVTVIIPGNTYTTRIEKLNVPFPCNHLHQTIFTVSLAGANGSGRKRFDSPLPGLPEFDKRKLLSIKDARTISPAYPDWYLCYGMADNYVLSQPSL